MKLVSDYRVRMTRWLYFMIIPLVVYFLVFKQYMYDLLVGGIMFTYFAFMIMFANRYIKVWLQSRMAGFMGIKHKVYYKTLKPQVVPEDQLSSIDVQKLEGYPVLMVMSMNFLMAVACYAVSKDAYITKLLFGSLILSFNIHYSNICRIAKTVEYPNAMFEYNEISMKIYDTNVKNQVVS